MDTAGRAVVGSWMPQPSLSTTPARLLAWAC